MPRFRVATLLKLLLAAACGAVLYFLFLSALPANRKLQIEGEKALPKLRQHVRRSHAPSRLPEPEEHHVPTAIVKLTQPSDSPEHPTTKNFLDSKATKPGQVLDIRECVAMTKLPAEQRSQSNVRECVRSFNRGPGGLLNLDLFPLSSSKSPDGVVIAFPIHNRASHMREVLRTWASNPGINETTLIISHDGYFEDVDNLVRSIRFVRVKQIYHPDAAFFNPDALWATHIHRFTRLKHHFWWMFNFIWRHPFNPPLLPPNKEVFINEDDLIAAPDAYMAAKAVFHLRATMPNRDDIFCVNLGKHTSPNPGLRNNQVYRVGFSSFQCLGWGIDQNMSERIFDIRDEYCSSNEYNWDWTFTHMMNKGLLPDRCLNIFWPRAGFHIGSCGTHIKSSFCEEAHVSAERIESTVFNDLRDIAKPNGWSSIVPPDPNNEDDHMDGKSRPPSQRSAARLNEGWTMGRVWPADLPNDDPNRSANHPIIWNTDVHKNHCLFIATEDMS